jgi:predicted AlkP superfamily pyrophosphatase or phosphodiesterase
MRILPLILAGTLGVSAAHAGGRVSHVLLISVDGLHQVDLARWVSGHPDSTLAKLSRNGVTYTNAKATTPSDSFPGLLALVTGGTPKVTGVYYLVRTGQRLRGKSGLRNRL